eukprot:g32557.t1
MEVLLDLLSALENQVLNEETCLDPLTQGLISVHLISYTTILQGLTKELRSLHNSGYFLKTLSDQLVSLVRTMEMYMGHLRALEAFLSRRLRCEFPRTWQSEKQTLSDSSESSDSLDLCASSSTLSTKSSGCGSSAGLSNGRSNGNFSEIERVMLLQGSTVPTVSWQEVVISEKAKRAIWESMLYPVLFAAFDLKRKVPANCILLWGPAGTGKTVVAKAAATHMGNTFLSITPSSILSKWTGQAERMLRDVFEYAKHHQPCTLFIDEIDSISSKREMMDGDINSKRLLTELLIQLSALTHKDQVTVLAATNEPTSLDRALLRRFQKKLHLDVPDARMRVELLSLFLKDCQSELTPEDLTSLSVVCAGWTGADIEILVREASMYAIREVEPLLLSKLALTGPAGLCDRPSPQPNSAWAKLTLVAGAAGKRSSACIATSGQSNTDQHTRSLVKTGPVPSSPGDSFRLRPVTRTDFDRALQVIRPSTDVLAKAVAASESGIERCGMTKSLGTSSSESGRQTWLEMPACGHTIGPRNRGSRVTQLRPSTAWPGFFHGWPPGDDCHSTSSRMVAAARGAGSAAIPQRRWCRSDSAAAD